MKAFSEQCILTTTIKWYPLDIQRIIVLDEAFTRVPLFSSALRWARSIELEIILCWITSLPFPCGPWFRHRSEPNIALDYLRGETKIVMNLDLPDIPPTTQLTVKRGRWRSVPTIAVPAALLSGVSNICTTTRPHWLRLLPFPASALTSKLRRACCFAFNAWCWILRIPSIWLKISGFNQWFRPKPDDHLLFYDSSATALYFHGPFCKPYRLIPHNHTVSRNRDNINL
jgi:hypothetical protein